MEWEMMKFNEVKFAQGQGAIFHPVDFTFEKRKEELAAEIQRLVLTPPNDSFGYNVNIAESGSISARNEDGTEEIVITSAGVEIALLRFAASLDANSPLTRVVQLANEVFTHRDMPAWTAYGFRVGLAFSFPEPQAIVALESTFMAPVMAGLAAFGEITNQAKHKVSLMFEANDITFILEIGTSPSVIAVYLDARFEREKDPKQTYEGFVEQMVGTHLAKLEQLVKPLLNHDGLEIDKLREGRF